jgi:coenzyme F420-0:L-glutamate ligase/coenzyme F420-1:gamma-L-glutamate ligase
VPRRYEVVGIEGLPEIHRGDDLAGLLVQAARAQGTPLEFGDLLVVSQKIVSKTEGRIVNLGSVVPSREAAETAAEIGRDPRLVEVILSESRRVVRKAPGVLIVETHHGWICANAGVDQSNVDLETASLLPEDSDRSARQLREGLRRLTGHDLGIIVADTFGRPWREGLTNVAIGVAGLEPIKSYLGEKDPAGYVLQATILAVADELAAAAEPIMGKLDRIPAVIIRGLDWPRGETGSRALIRDPARDLFR